MSNKIDRLNIHFEEFALKQNSSPGWELIPIYMNKLIEEINFNAWIFGWNKELKCYANKLKFKNENKHAFLAYLNESMKRDEICILKVSVDFPFEQLLDKNYSKISEGIIADK